MLPSQDVVVVEGDDVFVVRKKKIGCVADVDDSCSSTIVLCCDSVSYDVVDLAKTTPFFLVPPL